MLPYGTRRSNGQPFRWVPRLRLYMRPATYGLRHLGSVQQAPIHIWASLQSPVRDGLDVLDAFNDERLRGNSTSRGASSPFPVSYILVSTLVSTGILIPELLRNTASEATLKRRSIPKQSKRKRAIDTYLVFAPTSLFWINTLWFSSLIVSISSAFLRITVKQWPHEHKSGLFGDSLELVELRRYRLNNLVKWRAEHFVIAIPILLQLALVMFLLGLVILLWTLHRTTAAFAPVPAGIFVAFVAITSVLPLITPGCAYPSPQTRCLYTAWSRIRRPLKAVRRYALHCCKPVARSFSTLRSATRSIPCPFLSFPPHRHVLLRQRRTTDAAAEPSVRIGDGGRLLDTGQSTARATASCSNNPSMDELSTQEANGCCKTIVTLHTLDRDRITKMITLSPYLPPPLPALQASGIHPALMSGHAGRPVDACPISHRLEARIDRGVCFALTVTVRLCRILIAEFDLLHPHMPDDFVPAFREFARTMAAGYSVDGSDTSWLLNAITGRRKHLERTSKTCSVSQISSSSLPRSAAPRNCFRLNAPLHDAQLTPPSHSGSHPNLREMHSQSWLFLTV
ncbi:hypothetical protein NUW54_g7940 [Trametes sanguinea]|uniref:Uncharacterized protein n=1 Tax=Trametes sanguinea TaxID=158606 RepID=A0ACC1PJN1_9APHY|nr:hypothetical protein NUW54_g7940 [Trametes sanguinea]